MALKMACIVLVCMVGSANIAEAAISCGQVASYVAPCIGYLRTGGSVPSTCCNGVRSLNSAASATADRQAACRCLVSAASSVPGLNTQLISGLPSACGVNLPFKISASTNCNSIK
ncbi:hypothetical protein UlMin_000787 [Ulmus minor]